VLAAVRSCLTEETHRALGWGLYGPPGKATRLGAQMLTQPGAASHQASYIKVRPRLLRARGQHNITIGLCSSHRGGLRWCEALPHIEDTHRHQWGLAAVQDCIILRAHRLTSGACTAAVNAISYSRALT
jgi:hypothetical protein